MDHRFAADQQHGRQPQLGQEGDHGVVAGFQPGHPHRLVEDPPDGAAEARELAVLAGEGLHHAHAGDVLLGVRGEFPDPLLGLLDRRPRAAAVAVGDDHHERNRHQRDQPEPGVDVDHHHAGERDREHRLQDEHEAVAEEEAHRLQVDRCARHQLPGLLVVEEAELQALELSVHEPAQVVLDAERDAPGDHPPPDGQSPADQDDGEDRQRERQQHVALVGARCRLMVFGGQRTAPDCFDGPPRERGQRDRPDHRDAGKPPGGSEPATVGAEEAEQAPEDLHRGRLIVVRATIIALLATPRRAARCEARRLSWRYR